MHQNLASHFAKLEKAVKKTDLAEDRKLSITHSIGKLSALYAKYAETYESRYGEQIIHIVQMVLRELQFCPATQKLDSEFRTRLNGLHENLGIPNMVLKPLLVPGAKGSATGAAKISAAAKLPPAAKNSAVPKVAAAVKKVRPAPAAIPMKSVKSVKPAKAKKKPARAGKK